MRRSVFFINNNSLRDLIYSSLSFSTIHWMRLTEPPFITLPMYIISAALLKLPALTIQPKFALLKFNPATLESVASTFEGWPSLSRILSLVILMIVRRGGASSFAACGINVCQSRQSLDPRRKRKERGRETRTEGRNEESSGKSSRRYRMGQWWYICGDTSDTMEFGSTFLPFFPGCSIISDVCRHH